jgi:hypothetical protein
VPLDDVDSSDIDPAGRFAELLDRLAAAQTLMTQRHTAQDWMTGLEEAVLALAATTHDTAWQLLQLRGELGDIAEAAEGSTALLGLADAARCSPTASPAGQLYVAMTRARDVLWVGVLDPRCPVHELMRAVLGAEPAGGPDRFRHHGWTYEGIHFGLNCATCASTLHVCRKPYESAGRTYRFWALTCPTCLTSVAPDDLPPNTRKLLRTLG